MYILELTSSQFGRIIDYSYRYDNFSIRPSFIDVMEGDLEPYECGFARFSSTDIKRVKSVILDQDLYVDHIELWYGKSNMVNAHDNRIDGSIGVNESTRFIENYVNFEMPNVNKLGGNYVQFPQSIRQKIEGIFQNPAQIEIVIAPRPLNDQNYGENWYLSTEPPRLRIYYREKYSTITLESDSIEFGETIRGTLNTLVSTNHHDVTFTLGNTTSTIALAAGQLSFSFSVPLSMATEIPNSTVADISISATTYSSSDVLIGSTTVHCAASLPASVVPSITSITWAVSNNLGIPLSNQALTISTQVSGMYGATVNYTIETEGLSSYNYSLTIEKVAQIHSSTSIYRTITATVTVTDSRGRTNTDTLDIDVYEWDYPFITSMEIYRCNSQGVKSNDGHYIRVLGVYDCYPVDNQNSVQSCQMIIVARSTGARTDAGSLASNTPKLIGGGQLLSDEEYSIEFTITDNVASIVYNYVVYSTQFIMHFKHGGTGVAFGQAATDDNTVQVSPLWKLLVGNNIDVAAKLAELESRIAALEGN